MAPKGCFGFCSFTLRIGDRVDDVSNRIAVPSGTAWTSALNLVIQATKSIWWMPWRQEAMKDAGACEKPRGAGKQAIIRGYPNGETRHGNTVSSRKGSQRGELKHLSTRRKGNQLRLRQ